MLNAMILIQWKGSTIREVVRSYIMNIPRYGCPPSPVSGQLSVQLRLDLGRPARTRHLPLRWPSRADAMQSKRRLDIGKGLPVDMDAQQTQSTYQRQTKLRGKCQGPNAILETGCHTGGGPIGACHKRIRNLFEHPGSPGYLHGECRRG